MFMRTPRHHVAMQYFVPAYKCVPIDNVPSPTDIVAVSLGVLL